MTTPTAGGLGGHPGIGTRVLVPLDGTRFAEQALPIARLIARRAGGDRLLAHVVEPPAPLADVGGATAGVVLDDPRTTRELRRAAQDYLDDVVARMTRGARARAPGSSHPPIPTDDRDTLPGAGVEEASEGRFGDVASAEVSVQGVLLDGEPAHALHEAAVAHDADLVVLAAHDRSALGRLLLGSTAEHLAREPGMPVLIVRRPDRADAASTDRDAAGAHAAHALAPTDAGSMDPDVTTREAARLRHVLVPLDGSAESEAVLPPALALARLLEADVTLMTVHDPRSDRVATLLPTAVLDTGRDADPREVDAGAAAPDEPRAYLDALARHVSASGCRVSVRLEERHDVPDAVVRCAADLGADVIAMSTHGRGAWGRLVHGSVAEAVLHRVLMPVLLLRPPSPSDADVRP